MKYEANAPNATFVRGKVPRHARELTTSLHNGWTDRRRLAPRDKRPLCELVDDRPAAGGLRLEPLLAALVFVLATGRVRARREVGEKTADLLHQALHDTLTVFPTGR